MRNYIGWNDTTRKLVEEIQKNNKVSYLTSSKSHLHIRCPRCGDSKKNLSHAHLYIKLEAPYPFYCQRCHAAGIMDKDNLSFFNVKNSNTRSDVLHSVKKASKKFKSYTIKNNQMVIPIAKSSDKINQKKLDYFNSRLGLDLSFRDLVDLKIIVNLYDFLNMNKISFLTTKDDRFADTLDEHFIGFQSYDNNYLIMRNTSKDVLPKMRYYNYNIFNNYDNSKRFYVIPNKINILHEKINIIIAEGIFDIISIFYNLYNGEFRDDTIFVAVCGTGYQNVLINFAKMGFLDMNIHIYADKDQKIKEYKDLKKELEFILRNNKIKISWNKLQKDFGVPKDQIDYTTISI